MLNKKELRAMMAKRGVTQKELAKAIGISEASMCRKIKNGVFGTDEAAAIISFLKIEKPSNIFFAQSVT